MQMIDLMKRLAELDANNLNKQQGVEEGSGPKEKQKTPYRDINSPAYRAAADKQKQRMAKDTAAEPGKKLVDKIAKKGVEEGMPASVIKQKETLAAMSDEEFAKKYGSKSDEELMSMAWRHGYGKGSRVYVNKCSKGKKGVSESAIEEYGMMPGSLGSSPRTPASISMTADSGEELSGMLRDIMTLAGRGSDHDSAPLGTEPSTAAVVDIEPAGDGMGPPDIDSTSSMRAVIDKMNGDDDEEMKEWDNEPAPETTGYGANTPSGDDLHKEKKQYPAAQPGDNAMTATFEGLMAEYKKFVSEDQGVAEGSVFDTDTTGYTKNDMHFINHDSNQIKKIRAKLLKIPGFARKVNDETSQLQLAEKIFNLMKRGQTFDSALVLAQKNPSQQGVAEGSDSLTFWKREAQQAGGVKNIDWYAIGVEHGKQGTIMNPPYGVGARAVTLYSKGLDAGQQGVAEDDKKESPWDEGHRAGWYGKHQSPYKPGSAEHSNWEAGREQGREDRRRE